MITFLFWNLANRTLHRQVRLLVDEHSVDVVILAECPFTSVVLLEALNQDKNPDFHFPWSICEAIRILTRFPGDFLTPITETPRISIRRLSLPARVDIILAAAHLPSKMWSSGEGHGYEVDMLADLLRREEQAAGHSRTVVVGDLNANPFERAVVAASGLHAVMSRRVASRGARTVRGLQYPFFYNPMWSLFGDGSPGPPGTYYYGHSGHVSYFWNVFDQVLVRPALLDRFRNEDLRILTSVREESLLSRSGTPNKAFSDHLPVLFKLTL